MEIKVDNKSYSGEMTLRFVDVVETDEKVTYAEVALKLPKFLTSLTRLEAPIGIFENLNTNEIVVGTKDTHILYLLTTKHFVINETEIEKLLQNNRGIGT